VKTNWIVKIKYPKKLDKTIDIPIPKGLVKQIMKDFKVKNWKEIELKQTYNKKKKEVRIDIKKLKDKCVKS
jgi:pyruvate/2-oxoglutarate dehydrogenase complex dihydrolipoamide acyltransferase (E2) component